MIKLKNLVISLVISVGIGILSGFLTKGSSKAFSENFNQSVLTPPDWVFPVVWIILFTLMGFSAVLIYQSDCKVKPYALIVYGVQLVVNFFWSIFFFIGNEFEISFGWITILILLVMAMIILFYNCKPFAAYLQIPYLIWILFASYLNYIICILN